MQRYNLALLLILWLFVSACSSKVVSGGNSSGTTSGGHSSAGQSNASFPKNTEEDLSLYRPKFKSPNDSNNQISDSQPIQSAKTPLSDTPLHVNKKLDAILDTIAMRNKSIKFTNGFRIQIYVGNDRKAADDAKIYTYQKYPEIFPYLSYQQPIYKVKIGDFLNRMDAERYYADLKSD
jgi:hypothetical protein